MGSVDASSAAVGTATWYVHVAARHVDEPLFTDSPAWNLYPLTPDGLRGASPLSDAIC